MAHTQIFQCLAGSRLYGTDGPDSDWDYKAVHLPTKRDILLGQGKPVYVHSTGKPDARNDALDVDTESFTLQKYLSFTTQMQAIPVEMLFTPDSCPFPHWVWTRISENRDKILSRNSKSFAGYCKGQAIRYSMRGKRLDTYMKVCAAFECMKGMKVGAWTIAEALSDIDGVQIVPKEQPGGQVIDYLDVYGRQVPMTITCDEALKIYQKPVNEAGARAKNARDAGGMDCKALYHAVRIVDEGISLFKTGKIAFPCQNLTLLREIRSGTVEIDRILDLFDEKLEILEGIGEDSPLPAKPDRKWVDDLVMEVHEDIIRA